MEILVSAPWPGNVRQLLNVVSRRSPSRRRKVIPESLVRQALDVADTALTRVDEARKAFRARLSRADLRSRAATSPRLRASPAATARSFYRLLERHSLGRACSRALARRRRQTA